MRWNLIEGDKKLSKAKEWFRQLLGLYPETCWNAQVVTCKHIVKWSSQETETEKEKEKCH